MADLATSPSAPESAIVHRSTGERAELGKSARATAPRAAHEGWDPPATRPDPVALLESQAVTRVPELVPIRYGRMLVSPFTFYRGAALIMASDLSTTPRSGLNVQACGDAHLSNFGVFGSAERNLVFDLNDFDETLPGPWEWDVKRLAASLAIAGRDRGFSDQGARQRGARDGRGLPDRDGQVGRRCATSTSGTPGWTSSSVLREIGDQLGLVRRQRRRQGALQGQDPGRQGRGQGQDARQHAGARQKLTEVVDGETRFVSDPPLIVPIEELLPRVESARFTEASTSSSAATGSPCRATASTS